MAQEGIFEEGGGTELGCWELSAKKDIMCGIYQIDSHSHPCLPCLAVCKILTDGASKLKKNIRRGGTGPVAFINEH